MRVALWTTQPMMLFKGDKLKEYQPHQSNKKSLLYYNKETQTWEKPILRQWDSIEKHSDGKYYYHKRSGEVVLNGSENSWEKDSMLDLESRNTARYRVDFTGGNNSGNYVNTISNMFNFLSDDDQYAYCQNIEGICTRVGKISISITKSKLPTIDVEGFKQWLQANNVTVVYQLEQEEVYECTSLDLITYANETNYIVNAGAITPRTTLKLSNSVGNVVNLLKSKISILEDLVYKLIQNK